MPWTHLAFDSAEETIYFIDVQNYIKNLLFVSLEVQNYYLHSPSSYVCQNTELNTWQKSGLPAQHTDSGSSVWNYSPHSRDTKEGGMNHVCTHNWSMFTWIFLLLFEVLSYQKAPVTLFKNPFVFHLDNKLLTTQCSSGRLVKTSKK